MTTPISVYDATGRITLSALLSDATLAHYQARYAGFTIPKLSDPKTDYVLDGAIAPRPANPATLVGAKLSSLPRPCTITINGVEYACDNDSVELALTYPGSYAIRVVAFPCLDTEFEVVI